MAKLSLRVPMRWSDLDVYGHVNNARFLTMLEEARIKAFWGNDKSENPEADPELLASAKVLSAGAGSETITLVAGQRIEYVKPLEWTGQDLRVDLWLSAIGGASLEVAYEAFNAEGEVVAKATTSMVLVDAESGKPRRISDDARTKLSNLLDEPLTFRR